MSTRTGPACAAVLPGSSTEPQASRLSLTPAGSDASWLAHAIPAELSVGTGAGALLGRLEDDLRTAFEAATAHAGDRRCPAPSASA